MPNIPSKTLWSTREGLTAFPCDNSLPWALATAPGAQETMSPGLQTATTLLFSALTPVSCLLCLVLLHQPLQLAKRPLQALS